jgi:hypothetical protein
MKYTICKSKVPRVASAPLVRIICLMAKLSTVADLSCTFGFYSMQVDDMKRMISDREEIDEDGFED